MQRYYTIATAGHVDHGKTSLLRALTGVDPDRLKEEKEREMTTDLGFAPLVLPDLVIGFIDVPGHGRFIKNMLAGVGGVHLALLVVAADEGVMPQTLQHVKILSLLGIKRVVLALNKSDLASEEQIEKCRLDAASVLSNYGMEIAVCVPVSATSGANIQELKAALGKIAAEELDRNPPSNNQAVYLPVDRVFSKSGYGKVITGTLVSGHLKNGDNIFAEPGHRPCRVRGLETFGEKLSAADAGQRLAVNLSFKDEPQLSRGLVLSSLPLPPVSTLIVTVEDLGGLEYFGEFEEYKVKHRLTPQKIKVYHGTGESPGYLRWLESGFGQISLDSGVHMAARLGDRYVLRYGDHGIAGGEILSLERPGFLSRQELMPLVRLLADKDYKSALQRLLDISPRGAVRAPDLAFCLEPGLCDLDGLLAESVAAGAVKQIGEYYISQANYQKMLDKFLHKLKAAFAENKEEGAVIETLRQKSFPSLDRSCTSIFVDAVESMGLAKKEGERLLPPSLVEKKAELAPRAKELMAILKESPVLEFAEVGKRLNLKENELKTLTADLKKSALIEVVNYEFVASMETIDNAHRVLGRLYQQKRDISPSDFREAMNISRKYIMALLTYFDDRQITRRTASGRMLLKAPKAN